MPVRLQRRFQIQTCSHFVCRTLAGVPHQSISASATEGVLTQLRPYQNDCISTSLEAFEAGHRRIAVSMPVGSGKTVVFSNLIPRLPSRLPTAHKTLVLAHREELISQAHKQIAKHCPSLRVSVDMAKQKPDMSADVIVASVPTLGRTSDMRRYLYDPKKFKCIIIDEAHHASATTYQRILSYMGAYDDNSHISVWGCSATLRRHDGISLSPTFEKIVYHKPISEMICDNWLSDVRVHTIETNTSLSGIPINSTSKDFAVNKLAEAINTFDRNKLVVKVYLEEAVKMQRKSTIVFAIDIDHINNLVQEFRAAGVHAEGLSSETSTAERREIVGRFSSGDLPVLVNCGILTEGVDIPRTDCIMLARPTRSGVLLQQMIGRGMRLYDGKEYCLIFDFVDNFSSNRALLMTVPTLLGLKSSFDFEGESLKKITNDLDEINFGSVSTTFNPSSPKEIERYLASLKAAARHAEYKQDRLQESYLEMDDMDESSAVMDDIHYVSTPFLNPFLVQNVDDDTKYLQQISKMAWVRVGELRWALSLGTNGTILVEKDTEMNLYTAKHIHRRKIEKRYFQRSEDLNEHLGDCDSLSQAFSGVQTYLTQKHPYQLISTWMRNALWRYKQPSQKQLDFAKKIITNFDTKREITQGMVADLITRRMCGAIGASKKSATGFRNLNKQKRFFGPLETDLSKFESS